MLSNYLLIPHGKARREGGKGRWEGKVRREGGKGR
jgi:hypothetical protein